ncbi:MAG: VWA domain-containing protein [Burkholderiales bacterium]
MTFLWGKLLWMLLGVPALVAAYVLMVARKRPALRYSSLSLARAALGKANRMRRHMPPALLLLALVALLIAAARPAADLTLFTETRTIILAMDVSMSMSATDVSPSRLAAAQATAKAFIAALPQHVRVGIVTFAGTAAIAQVPTRNRRYLAEALDRIALDFDTAVGTGMIASLVALFPTAGIDGEFDIFGTSTWKDGNNNVAQPVVPARNKTVPFQRVPAGSYESAAIVLLTDGRSVSGMDPVAAARFAADRGVRVYTVGFGTPAGADIVNARGETINAGFDEQALRSVARLTQGKYFNADSAEALMKVYQQLTPQIVPERNRQTEITVFFTALGAVLLLVAGVLSLAWYGRTA